mgnify:CR=1 FL=1
MKLHSLILPFAVTSLFPFYQVQAQTDDIEKITVTATRTESQLLALDSNLAVVDSEALNLIEHEHISQALVRIPGGWISRGNGQEHLSAIRSPVFTGAGGCGAFFMAQDGISLRAPGFCNTNQLFDANTEQANSIEVLRGPASTIYGSNAVHGVINILTPNPLDDNPSDIGVTFGPHDYLRGDFSVSANNNNQGLMVLGNAAHDGGYKNDSGFEQQKVTVIHQYRSEKLAIKSVVAATNLKQQTAGFIKGDDAYKDNVLKRHNPNPEAFRDSQSFRAYSQIKYSIDDSASFSITPFVRWSDMAFLQHFLPWQSVEENGQQGFGFQSQYEKAYTDISWLIGLDVDATDGTLTERQAEPFSATIPVGDHYDYNVTAHVYSPFSKLTWLVSEQLQLSAGIRYEHTEYDYHNNLSDGDACEQSVDNCRFSRPTNQKVDYQEVSYQLGGNYALTPEHRLYGQFSTGYRAPQATELFRLQAGQSVADLAAENIKAIELGLRGQSGALFYDVNVFFMDKDNFIFQDTNKHNISNGETFHNGLEFSLHYQLPKNFYLNVNGTVANHKYASALTLSRTNIQGNEIDTAPQHMGSMQFGWNNQQGQQLELEWQHLGNYYVDPENTAEYSGHNLLNLRASLVVSTQLSISARLLNVTNQDYAERADYAFGSYRYFVGEPRSIFVSLRYQF